MSLSYEMSLENYTDFYITIKGELKENNVFGVVSEVNILDQFLLENLINDEFHKNNLPRCIKRDKENLNNELFISMFISSLLISMIYYYFIPQNKYIFFKICIFFYISIVYYLSFKYFQLIIINV
mgnify:CR=1 FL=1|tara:strand:+ start:241 stop:615 length:375 start_codon:yes stop_codon:yes gene_type:complete